MLNDPAVSSTAGVSHTSLHAPSFLLPFFLSISLVVFNPFPSFFFTFFHTTLLDGPVLCKPEPKSELISFFI